MGKDNRVINFVSLVSCYHTVIKRYDHAIYNGTSSTHQLEQVIDYIYTSWGCTNDVIMTSNQCEYCFLESVTYVLIVHVTQI
jgi:hypothetical protein